MTAYPSQTRMSWANCAVLWDSQSQPVVIQPGFESGTVVTPLAPRCIVLDRCATREYTKHAIITIPRHSKAIYVENLTCKGDENCSCLLYWKFSAGLLSQYSGTSSRVILCRFLKATVCTIKGCFLLDTIQCPECYQCNVCSNPPRKYLLPVT